MSATCYVMTDKKSIIVYVDTGLQFAIAVALGIVLGYFLDSKLNTLPIFLVIGLLFGAAAGFLNIYRAVYPRSQKDSQKSGLDED